MRNLITSRVVLKALFSTAPFTALWQSKFTPAPCRPPARLYRRCLPQHLAVLEERFDRRLAETKPPIAVHAAPVCASSHQSVKVASSE